MLHIYMDLYLLHLSLIPFVSHFEPPYEVNEGIAWVSALTSFLSICLPLIVWPFTFTEKSGCDITFTPKLDLVLSEIIIIQSWSNYCSWFRFMLLVIWYFSLSVFLSVSLKDMHFTSQWCYISYTSF